MPHLESFGAIFFIIISKTTGKNGADWFCSRKLPAEKYHHKRNSGGQNNKLNMFSVFDQLGADARKQKETMAVEDKEKCKNLNWFHFQILGKIMFS